ncbi:amino acid permease [Mycoplasmopsis phocirhinis]|uniref:Amino acid permease n=1 Tax=Mycoplasmopsis phocirhinis TaxID=142650 RepID=A0A4P6MS35_9BACT|nr:amino acid permease [Mycoplasmopsis phocirhinis]QBF34651.1 amino acid permease [Mycoplasmopsis phocirhinis]
MENKIVKRKIGFISVMLIAVGSAIGAGIFFKAQSVLTNSRSSLALAIFSWILAVFALITMALAIIEVASAQKDNLSFVGWNRIFNPRWVHKASKNFVIYLMTPLIFFALPLYAILFLQTGLGVLRGTGGGIFTFGTDVDWLIWLFILMGIKIYFILVSGLNAKIGSIHNIFFIVTKFIPIVLVIVIGIVAVAQGYGQDVKLNLQPTDFDIKSGSPIVKYGSFGVILGVFLSIGSIFFAYDGFYVAAGLQSEMKQPKKTGLALSMGILAITIIYVSIAISMSLSGGGLFGFDVLMKKVLGSNAGRILYGILTISVCLAILGIVNGYAMWIPRYVESLLAIGELAFWDKYINKLNPHNPKIGAIYTIIIVSTTSIIFTIIGALLYKNADIGYYAFSNDAAHTMANLYTFTDIVSNWITVFGFVFIGASIIGAYINRKTNKISVNKVKGFKFFAISALIFITLALGVQIFQPIIDLFLLIGFDRKQFPDAFSNLLVARMMIVLMLIIFIVAIFTITPIEDYLHKRKFGSIQKYNEYKQKILTNK